jgi:hypothetical protein
MWRRVDLVWSDVSEERLRPPTYAGSWLSDFSTLKMEAIRSSETSVHTRCTLRHIPEGGTLNSDCFRKQYWRLYWSRSVFLCDRNWIFNCADELKLISNACVWEPIGGFCILLFAGPLHFSPSCSHFGALGWFLSFLIILQTVGLLGRVISPSQGLYLNTWQHKHRINAYTPNIHALCGIWTHGPGFRTSEYMP